MSDNHDDTPRSRTAVACRELTKKLKPEIDALEALCRVLERIETEDFNFWEEEDVECARLVNAIAAMKAPTSEDFYNRIRARLELFLQRVGQR